MQQAGEKTKSRILVVEDHPIFRQGLVQVLNREPDLMVCCEADSAPKALAAIAAGKPDLAVVDISLDGDDGIELIKSLKALHKNLPVIVVSMHGESLYAERALRAGARGYVMKKEPPQRVVEAIRRVLSGKLYFSEEQGADLIEKFLRGKPEETGADPVRQLSDRELQVFMALGRGFKGRQLAEALHVSVKTIETHRMHIKRKLNLRTGAELLRFAVQWVMTHSAA